MLDTVMTDEMRTKYDEVSGWSTCHYPEHSNRPEDLVYNVHSKNVHRGKPDDPCTVHNMSEHALRWWKQVWVSSAVSSEKMGMWRRCQHSVLHPDPDDPFVTTEHECDDCCNQEFPESYPTFLVERYNKNTQKYLSNTKRKETKTGEITQILVHRKNMDKIIIVGEEHSCLIRTSKRGVSSLRLVHAEDVSRLIGAELKDVVFCGYSREEVESMPLHSYVGAGYFPEIATKDDSYEEGYLLGVEVKAVHPKYGEVVAVFSFLGSELSLEEDVVKVGYKKSLPLDSNENVSSVDAEYSEVEDFCLGAE